jgi:hypothetical protein
MQCGGHWACQVKCLRAYASSPARHTVHGKLQDPDVPKAKKNSTLEDMYFFYCRPVQTPSEYCTLSVISFSLALI